MSYISSGSVCLHLMTSVMLLNTDKKKKKEKILPKNNSVTCGAARQTQEKLFVQISDVQHATVATCRIKALR